MSANHQEMKAEIYLAKVKELEYLKHGDGEALRRAEMQARDALARMKRESENTQKQISQERRNILHKLRDAENLVINTLCDVAVSTEQAQQRVNQLQDDIKEVSKSISRIMDSAKETYATAEIMYEQVKAEMIASQLNPDYARFAQEELLAINKRIQLLADKDLSGPAMQAEIQMIMTDIFYMDVIVSNKRVIFIQDQAEALKLAEELLAKAKNVRNNNYEEVGKEETRLMDMDYWTDGCFTEMEIEVQSILQRIVKGQNNAHYSHIQLQKDLCRLRELEKVEDMLVVSARSKMNLSYYRKEQGELIQEILETDHRYTLIRKGFARDDEREAYILRMLRHTDGAQIEVIINPGDRDGESDVYFRVDSTTYMDSATMASVTEAIAKELEENGIDMKQYKACHPEQMPKFHPGDALEISNEARRYHSITERKPTTMSTPI